MVSVLYLARISKIVIAAAIVKIVKLSTIPELSHQIQQQKHQRNLCFK